MPPEDYYSSLAAEHSLLFRAMKQESDWLQKELDFIKRAYEELQKSTLTEEDVKHVAELISSLSYKLYAESSEDDKPAVATAGMYLSQKVTGWVYNYNVTKGKEKKPYDDLIPILRSGLEEGYIHAESISDIKAIEEYLGDLIMLARYPEILGYFASSDALMDIIRHLYSHNVDFRLNREIESLKRLYDHEMKLKEHSRIHQDDAYENFVSMPMEIKASMTQSFEHLVWDR